MKENKKKVGILVEEDGHSTEFLGYDEKKSGSGRLIKPLIFALMGVVFIGCMLLIFKPSFQKEKKQETGLNDSVPQPSEEALQADKQKAYEQEMLEENEQQKRNALTTLADYWNQDSGQEDQNAVPDEEQQESHNPQKSGNPALSSYRNAQNTLGSFYQNDNSETLQLRKQLEETKKKLAEKEVPAGVTAADQLALMEKSYQMAAKYLPSGTGKSDVQSSSAAASDPASKKEEFSALAPASKNIVSALGCEPSPSVIYNPDHGFYTADAEKLNTAPKNSIKAYVDHQQTIVLEGLVRLRLLEPAQLQNRIIPPGTILTAAAKIQTGRLQLKVSSVELQGSIIPVDIIIYDLDGQQGLNIPYSAEMSALKEIAANMGQNAGTSVMLTQSATQQAAADLSRGVVQGISGYFSRKVKTSKVTLKAGHQLLLVSKKQ
ncbi:conjugative transposon protein TraM [Flavobacterium sp. LHD-80]|uniref:conjugative transposon protein TraM n=1 Tax=Flavobacterium sp. LHD-80 TaxID=3071411 RepID=UPI0027DF345F|nr:conjugative transposon protein TraM [Flavobacterium sp. LHD-80]MDQ6472720.1 conjugative transposon protein TraM [Flavobacterium sp. LHD-80]